MPISEPNKLITYQCKFFKSDYRMVDAIVLGDDQEAILPSTPNIEFAHDRQIEMEELQQRIQSIESIFCANPYSVSEKLLWLRLSKERFDWK